MSSLSIYSLKSLNIGNHGSYQTEKHFSSQSMQKESNSKRERLKKHSQSSLADEDNTKLNDLCRRANLLHKSEHDLSRKHSSKQFLTNSLVNIFNFSNRRTNCDDDDCVSNDVRIIQMQKYQKLISNMDVHLAGLEDYMHRSNDWKHCELRQILGEQERTIDEIEREISLKEGQLEKKSSELEELRHSLVEAEAQLNYSMEANRKFAEDKFRYEEENIILKERAVEFKNSINQLKNELRKNDKNIERLIFLHTASANKARIPKFSRGTQTQGLNNLFLRPAKKVVRVDAEIQVESLKPKMKIESCDKECSADIH